MNLLIPFSVLSTNQDITLNEIVIYTFEHTREIHGFLPIIQERSYHHSRMVHERHQRRLRVDTLFKGELLQRRKAKTSARQNLSHALLFHID